MNINSEKRSNILNNNSGELTTLPLLDGATIDTSDFLPDVEKQKVIADSSLYLLEKRLEAYEDILESQVGDTTMTRARNIERRIGLRQLFLKFEGGNPTGTQKDRIAFAQVMDALRRGFDAITVATCGNYGVAIALAAFLAGLKCIIYIPQGYHTNRIKEILEFSAEIIQIPGDYENSVISSKERAQKEEIYDANPGGENTAIQLGLHIDCGLHDILSDDEELAQCAKEHNVRIRDIRKPPARDTLHFFCGKIVEVESLKIAVLGTDDENNKH